MVVDEGQITAEKLLNRPIKPQAIPKTQIAQRQVSEYQEGGVPFGLGYGQAPKCLS